MLLSTLPVHPQPLEGELLSSWMIRLAHGNGFKVQTFTALQFGRERSIWTRDIDHHAPAWLLERLASVSGQPIDRLEAMTLRAFEGRVFERLNPKGRTRFLLPLSVYHRARRGFGLQYCPGCLAEDSEPYFRLRWRLSLSCVCCTHRVFLRDRCPGCGQAMAAHRADMGSRTGFPHARGLWRCAHCQQDLRRSDAYRATADEVQLQRRLDDAMAAGFVELDGTGPTYSHLFFNGLRILSHGIDRVSERGDRLSKLESGDSATRLRLLGDAEALTHEWPSRLLSWCAGVRCAYSVLSNVDLVMPYWLGSVLRQQVFRAHAVMPHAEVAAIMAATQHAGLKGRGAARRLSGRDVGRRLPRSGCDEADAKALLKSLSASIRAATGARRWLLRRDRVMFVVARDLSLSMPDLAALKLGRNGGIQLPPTTGATAPRRDAARRALSRFACDVRPQACMPASSRSLFTAFDGHRLQASAIGERFRKAVRDACLVGRIVNWNHWIGPS